jgi:hypothetical protein
MGDELSNFYNPHFFGVTFVVVEDIRFNSVDVGFFGALRVLFEAELIAVLIEKFFRRRRVHNFSCGI